MAHAGTCAPSGCCCVSSQKIWPLPFCPQCQDFFKAGRGIYEDFCRRLPFYPSDFTDGRLDRDLFWECIICLIMPRRGATGTCSFVCHLLPRMHLCCICVTSRVASCLNDCLWCLTAPICSRTDSLTVISPESSDAEQGRPYTGSIAISAAWWFYWLPLDKCVKGFRQTCTWPCSTRGFWCFAEEENTDIVVVVSRELEQRQ